AVRRANRRGPDAEPIDATRPSPPRPRCAALRSRDDRRGHARSPRFRPGIRRVRAAADLQPRNGRGVHGRRHPRVAQPGARPARGGRDLRAQSRRARSDRLAVFGRRSGRGRERARDGLAHRSMARAVPRFHLARPPDRRSVTAMTIPAWRTSSWSRRTGDALRDARGAGRAPERSPRTPRGNGERRAATEWPNAATAPGVSLAPWQRLEHADPVALRVEERHVLAHSRDVHGIAKHLATSISDALHRGYDVGDRPHYRGLLPRPLRFVLAHAPPESVR